MKPESKWVVKYFKKPAVETFTNCTEVIHKEDCYYDCSIKTCGEKNGQRCCISQPKPGCVPSYKCKEFTTKNCDKIITKTPFIFKKICQETEKTENECKPIVKVVCKDRRYKVNGEVRIIYSCKREKFNPCSEIDQPKEIPTKNDASSEIHKTNTSPIKPEINESSLKVNIAYVNSDTVSKYYNYAKKLQKSLSTKRAEAESQIKNKYSSYEVLVREFEKASPIMGDREKMEKAQKIRMLEQEIMQVEQQLSQQLSSEELRLTEKYILKTNEFMQEIGKTLGFDYVMSYRVGGAMLYANSELDITSKIIELLNNQYDTLK